jgi:hypothetical protein
MLRTTLRAAAALALLACAVPPAMAAGPDAFDFAVVGDMPYKIPDDYAAVDRLFAALAAKKPAFALHVGDVKAGSGPCSDETLRKAFEQMNRFDGALIYTIGDNEWTDCHRKDAGAFDPRERLAKVREIFFATPAKSLGLSPISVESQGVVMDAFKTYVENTRFQKNGVIFVGLHTPGSNNGFESQDAVAAATEFAAREKANLAWLDASFAKARESGAKALVLFMQADFDESRIADGSLPRQSGFMRTLDAIEAGAKSFGRPVLLVHGDEHYFSVNPLRNAKGKPIPGVTTVMTYGEGLIHGLTISVDPDSPGVFGFTPVIVPENLPAKK